MVYWESIHLVSYLMQELILQVCRFCGLVCGTYKVFKIRVKVVLKIAWLVKTPWHDYIKAARFGLSVINSNYFIRSSFWVIPWMWITFTYGLPGINSPADEFSSLFRYGQQVNSKKLEILLLLLFKTAKSAEPLDTTRIYKRDAILEIQYSGGTVTSTCLVSKRKLNGLIWRRDKLCKYRSWATYKQRDKQLLSTCSTLWFLYSCKLN